MLTGRSAQACLSREVPTDHEAPAAAEKRERSCRALLRSRDDPRECTPEAKAEHRHDRVYAQALSEGTEAGQRRERKGGGNSVVPVSSRSHAQHVDERA